MNTVIDIVLFTMLVVTALAVVRTQSLFATVMLSGVFSLLSALLFITLDAVDVAFTEAAVGAGISTVLLLGTLALTSRTEKPASHSPLIPLVVVLVTGAVLIYGTLDMPSFGDPNSPTNTHVAPSYIADSVHQIDVPNMVTSILASYRGFDTLGETAVVFTAGMSVLLLISGRRITRREARKGATGSGVDRDDREAAGGDGNGEA